MYCYGNKEEIGAHFDVKPNREWSTIWLCKPKTPCMWTIDGNAMVKIPVFMSTVVQWLTFSPITRFSLLRENPCVPQRFSQRDTVPALERFHSVVLFLQLNYWKKSKSLSTHHSAQDSIVIVFCSKSVEWNRRNYFPLSVHVKTLAFRGNRHVVHLKILGACLLEFLEHNLQHWQHFEGRLIFSVII